MVETFEDAGRTLLANFFFFFFPFGSAKWIKYNGSFRGNECNVGANVMINFI